MKESSIESENLQEKFRYLFTASRDMIFVVDIHGHIVEMNKSGLEILGYDSTSYISLTLEQIFHDQKSLDTYLQCLERDGHVTDMEIECSGKDGSLAHVLLSATTLVNKEGNVTGSVVVAEDIGRLRAMKEQMAASEKMASIGQMAAGVAHEINTPLGVIIGYAQLMLEDFSPESEEYDNLKIIERQAKVCQKIVADLLKFSRQSGNIMALTDINEILLDVVAIVEHNLSLHSIRIHSRLAPDLPLVIGDAEKLRQVFINLVHNAQHAMEEQGKGELFLSTFFSERDAKVTIQVRDTGCGISDSVKAKIFAPFFTTKPVGKGTGLGLSVSCRIIQEHQGQIEVESPVRKKEGGFSPGTEFRVILPVSSSKKS